MRCFLKRILFFLLLIISIPVLAQEIDREVARNLVMRNYSSLGISRSDAENSIITTSYSDPGTGLQYIYLQQAFSKILVFNMVKTVAFKNEMPAYSSGRFFPSLEEKALNDIPSVSASAAIHLAAQHLSLSQPLRLEITDDQFEKNRKLIFNDGGIAKQEIVAELFWVVTDKQEIRLAWNINIDVKGSSDWWNVRIDALNGEVLEKDNWTVNELHHSEHSSQLNHEINTEKKEYQFIPPPPSVTQGTYFVVPFPGESPMHKAHAQQVNPWLKAGAINAATTHGWHFDGMNNYNFTRGNNVFAYLDYGNPSNAPNATSNWPDTSSTAIPALNFTTAPDFTKQPGAKENKKSAVTNLFYWNNIIHDILYQYGFNEASGNFQADNIGRGGAGSDYVQAEAQDASGTDNANFATPADGTRPRMQMFLWTAPTPLVVHSPSAVAGTYGSEESAFSANNKLADVGPVTAQVIYFNDNAAGTLHLACLGAANSLTGKIAMIDRGDCNFTEKVKNAQLAGAVGVIIVNNVSGAPIIMGGTDNTITIPAVMISQSNGAAIAAQLSNNVTATLAAGISIDGDFDNGVVVHEYGHGVSNRLTGGPSNASCLNNAEQAGEGWSDYLCLMLTTDWQNSVLTDGPVKRGIGNYAIGQPVTGNGIRAYPYSTNMTINPLTYSDLAVSQQVHFVGTVWCTALWDMTWNIIQQSGSIEPDIYKSNSNGGNAIALRLVMEGMRFQPCRPGFIDARNAILAADSILYNGTYKCAIWKAFARRGMGFSAQQGLSTSATDQVPAFDLPSSVKIQKSIQPVILTNGEQHTININAVCECQLPSSTLTIKESIPAGFSYVSSTGGTLNGQTVDFTPFNFTALQEVKNFSITIKAETSGCVVDSAIKDNREGNFAGGLSAVSGWVSSPNRSRSAPNSWFVANGNTASDFSLTSQAFSPNELSVLSVWHYFVTENRIDGGRIEISTDGGSTWLDAAPYFIFNGYNNSMISTSPWGAGEKAFSGVSYGQGSNQFMNSMIDLSSFNGQSIRVRFRMRTNGTNSGSYDGWFLDDIYLMNGCGALAKTTLLGAGGAVIDTRSLPLFIRPSANAPSILSQPAAVNACAGSNVSFAVTAGGTGTLTYQWQVSINNGPFSDIAGATAATLQLNNVQNILNGNRYRVLVNNGQSFIFSSSAQLTVQSETVAGNIMGVTACEGNPAAFSVIATGQNLSYQWQVSTNGTTYTDIAGATNSQYSIPGTALSQNGQMFRVSVTGTCGTVISNAATLNVNQAPLITIGQLPSGVCSTDPPVLLTASVAGGIWSGNGVNGQQFVPSTPGVFTVTYTAANSFGCTGTATANISVIKCVETNLALDAPGAIVLFPNPSDGKFGIRFNTDRYSSLSIKLFASDGKLVYSDRVNGISYGMVKDFNLVHLAGDVYQVSLSDEVSKIEKIFRLIIIR